MQQLEQNRQTNALNQMKMQEMQQGMDETNAMRRFDPSSPTYVQDITRINPKIGFALAKSQQEAKTAGTEGQIKDVKLLADKLALLPEAYKKADTPEAYMAVHKYVHSDPVIGPFLKSTGATPEKGMAQIEEAIRTGKFAELRQASMQGVSQVLESMKPKAEQPDVAVMKALGYPTTPEGYKAFREAQRAERPDRLLTPEEEAQKVRLAIAGRAPAQPRAEAAPSITTIIDPTDPSKMITVDARRYQGGGVGSPGVIGVGGKEPGAALRVDKAQAGKTQLADDLDNLRASFTRLDELRAIPSTERNVVSNFMSAAGSSGIGQTFGRAGGSTEQVERDVINSARQRLISSIKNATGMSAKSLDSNVELKTMLNSISDPSQSFQAAMRIIDDIENAYVKGDGMLPKRGQQVPQSEIDALLNKYK
jgi:hypothetical protein